MRLLLLLLVVALSGCLDSPIGQYRVDEVVLNEASCTGIDQTRGATWTEAMRQRLISEMLIGEEDGVVDGPPVAQFIRDDASVFTVEIAEVDNPDGDDPLFAGERVDDAVTVLGAGLGADFSALLEADNVGCEIEYTVLLDLLYRGGDWDEAISTLTVEVGQPFSSTNACVVESCRAQYRVAARHTSGIDPGLRSVDEG